MDSTVLKYFALLSNSSFENFILNFPFLFFCAANYWTFCFYYTMLYIKNKSSIKVIVFSSRVSSHSATTASWSHSGYIHVLKWTIGYNKVL